MAVNYKIYQSNRNDKTKGNYYARATYHDFVNIKELAKTMQANCTVKYSDIVAVLAELSEVMRIELLRSNKVRIEGLGTFKVGLSSRPCTDLKDWSSKRNIIGSHIIFLPEVSHDANGTRTKALLTGLKVQEANAYQSLKDDNTANDGE